MHRIQRHLLNCLYATAAIVVVTAVALPASAGQPECPCWDGQIGLAADLASGTITTCDTHPVTVKKETVVSHSATANGGSRNPSANAGLSDGAGACSFNSGQGEITLPTPTDIPTTWACIRDIGAVCRGFGF
jgi:hypothetical protein